MNKLEKTNFKLKYSCYNENILFLSRYLIQLFFMTGNKYKCTCSKINKLLIIYKLCLLKENLNFDAVVESGVLPIFKFNFLKCFYPDIIIEGTVIEDEKIIKDDFNKDVKLSPMYADRIISEEEYIGTHSKNLIISIFRKFGNYSSDKLESMIREFSSQISYSIKDGKVYFDSLSIQNFFKNKKEIELNSQNEIIKFIDKFESECECKYNKCYSNYKCELNDIIYYFNNFYFIYINKYEITDIINYLINIDKQNIVVPKIKEKYLNWLEKFTKNWYLRLDAKKQKEFIMYLKSRLQEKNKSKKEVMEMEKRKIEFIPNRPEEEAICLKDLLSANDYTISLEEQQKRPPRTSNHQFSPKRRRTRYDEETLRDRVSKESTSIQKLESEKARLEQLKRDLEEKEWQLRAYEESIIQKENELNKPKIKSLFKRIFKR